MTDEAATTYLSTRCINSLSVKETHIGISYELYISNIPCRTIYIQSRKLIIRISTTPLPVLRFIIQFYTLPAVEKFFISRLGILETPEPPSYATGSNAVTVGHSDEN